MIEIIGAPVKTVKNLHDSCKLLEATVKYYNFAPADPYTDFRWLRKRVENAIADLNSRLESLGFEKDCLAIEENQAGWLSVTYGSIDAGHLLHEVARLVFWGPDGYELIL